MELFIGQTALLISGHDLPKGFSLGSVVIVWEQKEPETENDIPLYGVRLIRPETGKIDYEGGIAWVTGDNLAVKGYIGSPSFKEFMQSHFVTVDNMREMAEDAGLLVRINRVI